jgi:hypothetical protein
VVYVVYHGSLTPVPEVSKQLRQAKKHCHWLGDADGSEELSSTEYIRLLSFSLLLFILLSIFRCHS